MPPLDTINTEKHLKNINPGKRAGEHKMCLSKAAESFQLMAYIKEIQIEKKTHLLSVVSSNGTINGAFIVAKTLPTNYHPAFQGFLYTAWFPIFIELELAQASKHFHCS